MSLPCRWLRYRFDTARLADLVRNEDLTAILVGHVRFWTTLGTGGGDGERPYVRVVGEMQVVTLGGDDTRSTRGILCGSEYGVLMEVARTRTLATATWPVDKPAQ